MRIRKRRLHNPLPPPDLSSPPPLMAPAATEVAPAVAAVAGAAGGKEGEAIAAAAAGVVYGSGGGSGGGGVAGGGGRGLHPNGDLPAQHFPGCTTQPTFRLPNRPPLPEEAKPEGKDRGDLPPRGPRLPTRDGHGGEVLKQEQDGGDGDAHRRWSTYAHSGAVTATAPKSSGADEPDLSLGHGGLKAQQSNGLAAAAEAMAKCSGEEKGFPLKKRRRCYRSRGAKLRDEEEEERNGVDEREVKSKPSKTRRRRAAAISTSTTMVAAGTVLTATSATDNIDGAATAASAGDAKKRDDVVVKEEGGDVMSAVGAAVLVDGNRGGAAGKKRRSPAVLMEGSRCSRVNGRGWRCCQQTLVGYSLCEHHLGKGRLRSVSSVRCNGRARKKEEADAAELTLPPPMQQQPLAVDGEDEEENPIRRRKKIGTVKARSISSLLHQTDYSTPTAMAAPSPSPSAGPAPATLTVRASAAAPPQDNNSLVA